MEADFFGNVKKIDPKRGCSHMNAEYVLHTQGSIKLRSTYEPGEDSCKEVGRSMWWNSGVQGGCLDCGKKFFYGYSSIPLFIKRRLGKATVPGPHGEDLLKRIKEGR